MLIFLPEKIEKLTQKCVKAPIKKTSFFIKLYKAKVLVGSGPDQKGPYPTGSATLVYGAFRLSF